jgi:cardiolipin synthase A/B
MPEVKVADAGRPSLRRGDPPNRARRLRPALVVAAAATLFLLVLLSVTLHHVLDATRGTPLGWLRDAGAQERTPPIGDARFPDVVSVLAAAPLAAGNSVEIFVTGADSFRRLFDDLRAARRSITFQSYYCDRGQVADSLAAILAERAASGTSVFFLADGFGCRGFVAHYGPALRRAGVEVAVLRPVRWYTLHRAQHRSHVRLAVIDGSIAHTGGFGVDDKWLTADGTGWRDTNVRFTGPSVMQAQAAFLAGWAEATGELIAGADVLPVAPEAPFPEREESGSVLAGVQHAGLGLGTTPFERLLFLTISGARERLYFSSAYFVPSPPIRALLIEAVQRGVDVQILTAGVRTDVPTTHLAARAYYDELLSAGIRIHEYAPTMMHAKTFVADGTWSAIGGMNIDNRSIRLNDELNLLVFDAAVGTRMEQIFADDLTRSVEITLDQHRARSRMQRWRERLAQVIAPLL